MSTGVHTAVGNIQLPAADQSHDHRGAHERSAFTLAELLVHTVECRSQGSFKALRGAGSPVAQRLYLLALALLLLLHNMSVVRQPSSNQGLALLAAQWLSQ